jgi:hypothetical protein
MGISAHPSTWLCSLFYFILIINKKQFSLAMQCEDLQHNFLFWDNNSAMYKLLMDEFAPSKFLKLNPNFALA